MNGILPRIIRLRDAPDYLGMDKNRFNAAVRPRLHEKRMGKQGVAFDRLELDAWADNFFGSGDQRELPSPSKDRIEARHFTALADRIIKKKCAEKRRLKL